MVARARDLLAVKGYDVSRTRLACYSGRDFDEVLRETAGRDASVLLVDVAQLYGRPASD